MVQTEGGVNSQATSVAVAVNSTANTGAGVGAQAVRCLVGQRERVAVLKVFDSGPSTGAVSIIAQGSLDGTNWVDLGTAWATPSTVAVTATRSEVVTATPWVRMMLTTQGGTVYQCSMWVTE